MGKVTLMGPPGGLATPGREGAEPASEHLASLDEGVGVGWAASEHRETWRATQTIQPFPGCSPVPHCVSIPRALSEGLSVLGR